MEETEKKRPMNIFPSEIDVFIRNIGGLTQELEIQSIDKKEFYTLIHFHQVVFVHLPLKFKVLSIQAIEKDKFLDDAKKKEHLGFTRSEINKYIQNEAQNEVFVVKDSDGFVGFLIAVSWEWYKI